MPTEVIVVFVAYVLTMIGLGFGFWSMERNHRRAWEAAEQRRRRLYEATELQWRQRMERRRNG